ncbi:MAG: hypothetical protein LBK94_02450 [Prevotellaceae bacterium]|nr:hypothetical protein [Prevotellaceae bacterium]
MKKRISFILSTLTLLFIVLSVSSFTTKKEGKNSRIVCECPNCKVELGGGYYYEKEWVDCNRCVDGYYNATCDDQRHCSNCVRNGYTTDKTPNCRVCGGDGWMPGMCKKECNNCSKEGGWYEDKQHFTGYMCPRCKKIYKPCQ